MDADLSKKTPEELNVLLLNTAENDKVALVKKWIKLAVQHKQQEVIFRLLTELSQSDIDTIIDTMETGDLSTFVKSYYNEIDTLKKRIIITVHHLGGNIPLSKNDKAYSNIIEAARDLRPEWYPTLSYNQFLDNLLK